MKQMLIFTTFILNSTFGDAMKKASKTNNTLKILTKGGSGAYAVFLEGCVYLSFQTNSKNKQRQNFCTQL